MTTHEPDSDSRLTVWGHTLDARDVSEEQRAYLATLPHRVPDVNWIWGEMNRVWRDIGLDNSRPLKQQADNVGRFYSHPIWLANGLFTVVDPESARHRAAIAAHLKMLNASTIADYGGGFGELALSVVRLHPGSRVTVIEPYPSQVGLRRLAGVQQIDVRPDLNGGPYDAVLAQDVLEHVDDPVALAYDLARRVRRGGHLIVANCFHPMIDCHLPATFHLRHTFDHVMRAMGLVFCGKVQGAPNARVFRVDRQPSLVKARAAESASKAGAGQLLNALAFALWRVRRTLGRQS